MKIYFLEIVFICIISAIRLTIRLQQHKHTHTHNIFVFLAQTLSSSSIDSFSALSLWPTTQLEAKTLSRVLPVLFFALVSSLCLLHFLIDRSFSLSLISIRTIYTILDEDTFGLCVLALLVCFCFFCSVPFFCSLLQFLVLLTFIIVSLPFFFCV